MKFHTSLALIVVCGLVACSQALPAKKRLAYYPQPAAAQYYAAPQRMMFMRYVQPSYGNARSHQAAAALVAGDSVATGTYLQGVDGVAAAAGPVEAASFSGDVQDDAVVAAGAHVAHSIAEAYPAASAEEQHKITVQVDLDPASAEASDDDAKEGREYSYDAPVGGVADVEVNLAGEVESPEPIAPGSAADAATVSVGLSGAAASEVPVIGGASASKGIDVSVSLPAPAPIAPVVPLAAAKPAKGYLPAKRKVIVELEQAAESEDDADNAVAVQDDDDVVEEDDHAYAPVPVAPKVPARRPVAKKPAKAGCAGCSKAAKPLPAGTFFPVDFGGATGGAIAIANSFSTGESGSATSHAIAYGNPDQARARLPARRRH